MITEHLADLVTRALQDAAEAQGAVVGEVLRAGEVYGTGEEYAGRNVNLEFVSANPTGPLHMGATRWAAVGDALGRILVARGAKVTREYYFNDAGAQIDRFVKSLVAAANSTTTVTPAMRPHGVALCWTTLGRAPRAALLVLPLTMNRPDLEIGIVADRHTCEDAV